MVWLCQQPRSKHPGLCLALLLGMAEARGMVAHAVGGLKLLQPHVSRRALLGGYTGRITRRMPYGWLGVSSMEVCGAALAPLSGRTGWEGDPTG